MRSKLKTTVLQIIIRLHQLLLNTVQHSGFHCTPNWTELVDDDRTRFSPAECAHVRLLARKVKSFLTRRLLSGWSWTRIIAPRIAIHHAAAARGRERKSGARKTKKRTERRTLKNNTKRVTKQLSSVIKASTKREKKREEFREAHVWTFRAVNPSWGDDGGEEVEFRAKVSHIDTKAIENCSLNLVRRGVTHPHLI